MRTHLIAKGYQGYGCETAGSFFPVFLLPMALNRVLIDYTKQKV